MQIRSDASRVHTATLTTHAQELTELADEAAALVPRMRAEQSAGRHVDSLSAQRYAAIALRFNENAYALAEACPDSSHGVRIGWKPPGLH